MPNGTFLPAAFCNIILLCTSARNGHLYGLCRLCAGCVGSCATHLAIALSRRGSRSSTIRGRYRAIWHRCSPHLCITSVTQRATSCQIMVAWSTQWRQARAIRRPCSPCRQGLQCLDLCRKSRRASTFMLTMAMPACHGRLRSNLRCDCVGAVCPSESSLKEICFLHTTSPRPVCRTLMQCLGLFSVIRTLSIPLPCVPLCECVSSPRAPFCLVFRVSCAAFTRPRHHSLQTSGPSHT